VFKNDPYTFNHGPRKLSVNRCRQLYVVFRSSQAILFYYAGGFVMVV
jgi:hypothetical protein